MKKPKGMETGVTGDDGTLDQISKLPEPLLVRIISLLPLKDAAKTCLVSKRWQYLWTSIDSLSLICSEDSTRNCPESEVVNFVSFVDSIFTPRTSSEIRKFHLQFCDMANYNSHINQWLTSVMNNKLEHVVLKSTYFKFYILPQFFCKCSSLITLDLFICAFDKGTVISWKSLKRLKFEIVELDDEMIAKLLSGCPALETMELTCFYGFRRLEINSSNLKRLKLDSFCTVYETAYDSLEIVAPYLQHLEISGSLDNFKCRLVNVSSLVSAKLTFEIRCISDLQRDFVYVANDSCRDYHRVFWNLVQDYLRKLSNVTELTVAAWFTEVLFKLLRDRVQLPELKCKCLTVELLVIEYNLYGVASLLRASPHVETLNIVFEAEVYRLHCRYESSYLRNNIDLDSWISNFGFPSLKNVNIICSFRMCGMDPHDKLCELLAFLLKNAVMLEKLVIIAKKKKCYDCSKDCVSPYLSRLAAKLLVCPRSCSCFTMTFHESDYDD